MKKRFDRYFGNNLGRKFYIASLSVLAVGVLIGYLMWWGYGMPFIAVGVIGYLVSAGFQGSDDGIGTQRINISKLAGGLAQRGDDLGTLTEELELGLFDADDREEGKDSHQQKGQRIDPTH